MAREGLKICLGVSISVLLVVGGIVAVVMLRCPRQPENREWWRTATLYQTLAASYKDSDGDGTGDLRGIINNLDYLNGEEDSLGVDSIILNPIFPSGGQNNYYDALDFFEVAPEFGTLADFADFVDALHRKDMKQVFAFLPNHSSNKHPWFLKSVQRDGKYTDYYVWADGKNGSDPNSPPNNWQALDGGSAWTYIEDRGQFYLHQFSDTRADLNARSPDVQEEYEKILTFWLEKGVDGFNAEGVQNLFECEDLEDEPVLDDTQPLSYNNLDHTCTLYQPESFEIVTKWRKLLDDYGEANDKDIMLIVNSFGNNDANVKFYEYQGEKGADMTTNWNFLFFGPGADANAASAQISNFLELTGPGGYWNNWRTGNAHFTDRIVSRFGNRDMINAMNMLGLTLPGMAAPYYGEEIGMKQLNKSRLTPENDEIYDIRQTPLQWSDAENAGFTTGATTWVPIPDDYEEINIENQRGVDGSNLEIFRSYVKLRKEPSFKWGEFKMAVVGNILFYVRKLEGYPGYLIAINFGPESSTANFVSNAPDGADIPDEGEVAANTANFDSSDFNVGQKIVLTAVTLEPAQGIVIKLPKTEFCWSR